MSPGGATRRANLVHGGRQRRGGGALRSPSDRARASRAKVASFAHHATLPNEDYHTEKSVLFSQIDRLDGFRAKRADTAFRRKTRRNISRLQWRENGNHPPHSKPITHAHVHAGRRSGLLYGDARHNPDIEHAQSHVASKAPRLALPLPPGILDRLE